jgi:excinuclease ABC subunit A
VGRVHHLEVRRNQRAKSALYLLEEPTIGLHMADVRHLLEVLHRLVDAGNTVVVIEHHPAVIAEADHIVEVGPEAGEHGGRIVAEGTPERLAELGGSRIGPFLRDILLRSGGVGTACLPAAANRAGESAARRKKGIRK